MQTLRKSAQTLLVELEIRCSLQLSYGRCLTARAAQAAAKSEKPLEVSNTAQLRDLAASAARIFGWDSDKPGVQLNQQFVITQEQLEQMRALCDNPFEKPAISEPGSFERKNNEH